MLPSLEHAEELLAPVGWEVDEVEAHGPGQELGAVVEDPPDLGVGFAVARCPGP